MPGPGRPALPEADRRKRRTVWLSDVELAEVERLAALACVPPGEWMRRRALRQPVQPRWVSGPRPPPELLSEE